MTPDSQRTARLSRPLSRPIGVHVSIAGGFTKALERAENLGCTAMQIFCGNPRGWKPLRVSPDDVAAYRVRKRESPVRIVTAHAIYLINPAASNSDLRQKSFNKLTNEIDIASKLGADFYLIHTVRPGPDAPAALERYCETVSRAADAAQNKTKILIENTSAIEKNGKAFGLLGETITHLKENNAVGVCLDTAHLFGAGFDLRTKSGIDQMLREFDSSVGLDRLCLFHTNDSKAEQGSGLDRHEHIGKGMIGSGALKILLCDSRVAHIPLVLETPHMTDDDDRRNLRAARRLLGAGKPEEGP